MDPDDSRIIARFQRLTTELLAEKRLGQWHPELVDELYQTSRELEQRGLKNSPEYRNAMLRADEQACRIVEWARISKSDSASPPDSAPEEKEKYPGFLRASGLQRRSMRDRVGRTHFLQQRRRQLADLSHQGLQLFARHRRHADIDLLGIGEQFWIRESR